MKLIKIFLALSVLVISSCVLQDHLKSTFNNSNSDQEKQYVLGTNDIPLFDGLELVENDSTNFDTMLGDIVISKYSGGYKLKKQPVREFYLQTLPQLGWTLVDNNMDKISFKREKDKLEIKFSQASRGLYIHFLILSVLQ